MIDLGADGIDDFAEVVRGEVGGHADGDAGAAVDEEVRKGGGQHGWFILRAVVVRLEVHGILVEVLHHCHAQVVQAGLGVTHRRGTVAFNRAEVTLAIHQHFAHRPWLAHVDEGRIDRLVAVRVEITHGFTDDFGAFDVRFAGAHTELAHGIEHAALGRFEAISNIRQGAGDDHRHRVFQERLG